jgi:hypothetical protein
MDFWLFDHLKNSLVRRTSDEPEELLEAVTSLFEDVYPSEL